MHAFFESGMHWKLFNFFVFVGVLVYFLKKPLRQFWIDRRRLIETELNEVARQSKIAHERHTSYQKRLSKIETEIQELISAYESEGIQQKKKIMEDIQAWQKRSQEEAVRLADQEVERARQALQKEASLLATNLAAQLVRDNIKDEDQGRLAESGLKRLEQELT